MCNRVYGHRGKQKQDNKNPKWGSRACFAMYGQGQKMHHVDKDDCGVQRGSFGSREGEQGVHST